VLCLAISRILRIRRRKISAADRDHCHAFLVDAPGAYVDPEPGAEAEIAAHTAAAISALQHKLLVHQDRGAIG